MIKSFLIKIESKFFKKKIYLTYKDALRDCLNKGYEDEDLARAVCYRTELLREDLTRGSYIKANITEATAILISILKSFDSEARVLDFGGGCGAHYFVIKKILGQKYKLNWLVAETKMMCRYGRKLENGELKFFDDICMAKLHMPDIDVINVSGSLQYTDEPYKFLNLLLRTNAKFILFSRMYFTSGDKDIISIQKSMLGLHANGKLPLGVKNKVISFPITAMQKVKLDALAQQEYEYCKAFTDNSGVIRINSEPTFGLGLLCKHKH